MLQKLQEIRELLKKGKAPHFREDDHGTLWYKNRICVPDVKDLRKLILSEARYSLFYPSGQHEDVLRSEGTFLVVWDEAFSGRVRGYL